MSPLNTPMAIVESWLVDLRTDAHSQLVTMTFRKNDREYTLRAEGVNSLRLDDYREQNIVEELRVLGSQSEPEQVRDGLAFLLFDRDNDAEVTEPEFRAKLEQCFQDVLAEQKTLIELVPVCGAGGFLLARTIEWVEELKAH
jgi:hypothetical protein